MFQSLREINAAMNNTSITRGSFKRSAENSQEEIDNGSPSPIRLPIISSEASSGKFSSKKLRGLINDRQVK